MQTRYAPELTVNVQPVDGAIALYVAPAEDEPGPEPGPEPEPELTYPDTLTVTAEFQDGDLVVRYSGDLSKA